MRLAEPPLLRAFRFFCWAVLTPQKRGIYYVCTDSPAPVQEQRAGVVGVPLASLGQEILRAELHAAALNLLLETHLLLICQVHFLISPAEGWLPFVSFSACVSVSVLLLASCHLPAGAPRSQASL